MYRLNSASPESVLAQALEATFRGYEPYHRQIPLSEVMGRFRSNYYSACARSDTEMRQVVTRYATAHGFNVFED